ncbi:class I SAM-dependent methyltransferase [Dyella jejuensis]|uniref:Class I SAM-dependent methyltransferase n=1 Tax=Dyella jejuensis TaxID=1432009 RepID=A0ABW8JIR6_9GAMM
MATSALKVLLDCLEQDRSWRAPDQLQRRVDALDRLESCLIHVQAMLEPSLYRRVEAIQLELEAINRMLYRSIRDEIRRGAGVQALLPWMTVPEDGFDQDGYDHLDALASGVLQLAEPEGDIADPLPGMVFYQPTPARHIFDFIRHASLGERDVLIDLGSGLGHVPLLAAACTPARCVGIEREPAYVASARQAALALKLGNATFLQQDARSADVSEGTVFYLYTPFTGVVLRSVLDMLRREARRREIRLGTFGPCTSFIAQEAWLRAEGRCTEQRVAMFHSAG